MFDGALLVDKPSDWTSHDVVAKIRGRFQFPKVGHCGTLDPMATGLLVIVLGKGTKLSNNLMGDDKRYEGEMTLGVETSTYDAEGEILENRLVPPLTEGEIREGFRGFTGDQYQIPPMVSAIKIKGQPLYKMARKGEEVEREPRFIHVYELRLLSMALPRIEFDLFCTKGTYVRSLAHDLGQKLGCGAHLSRLRRTQSGKFRVVDALPLAELIGMSADQVEARVIPLHALGGT
ncbi:MAG: tRNA pseudouridine(55) synthase TruB [Verrucomicrobiae bacterium]|nr:tRNA pseudouridine(55) synthase TruB [Verrucomicrobiae bacterium]